MANRTPYAADFSGIAQGLQTLGTGLANFPIWQRMDQEINQSRNLARDASQNVKDFYKALSVDAANNPETANKLSRHYGDNWQEVLRKQFGKLDPGNLQKDRRGRSIEDNAFYMKKATNLFRGLAEAGLDMPMLAQATLTGAMTPEVMQEYRAQMDMQQKGMQYDEMVTLANSDNPDDWDKVRKMSFTSGVKIPQHIVDNMEGKAIASVVSGAANDEVDFDTFMAEIENLPQHLRDRANSRADVQEGLKSKKWDRARNSMFDFLTSDPNGRKLMSALSSQDLSPTEKRAFFSAAIKGTPLENYDELNKLLEQSIIDGVRSEDLMAKMLVKTGGTRSGSGKDGVYSEQDFIDDVNKQLTEYDKRKKSVSARMETLDKKSAEFITSKELLKNLDATYNGLVKISMNPTQYYKAVRPTSAGSVLEEATAAGKGEIAKAAIEGGDVTTRKASLLLPGFLEKRDIDALKDNLRQKMPEFANSLTFDVETPTGEKGKVVAIVDSGNKLIGFAGATDPNTTEPSVVLRDSPLFTELVGDFNSYRNRVVSEAQAVQKGIEAAPDAKLVITEREYNEKYGGDANRAVKENERLVVVNNTGDIVVDITREDVAEKQREQIIEQRKLGESISQMGKEPADIARQRGMFASPLFRAQRR